VEFENWHWRSQGKRILFLGCLLAGSFSRRVLKNMNLRNSHQERGSGFRCVCPAGDPHFSVRGHCDRINALAALSGSHQAISASNDKTLKLWDLATGECILTLEEHEQLVNAVAVLPGDQYAISGSYDHTLKVWDLRTGSCLKTLRGHRDWVNSVVLTTAGDKVKVISASDDKTLKLWDLWEASSDEYGILPTNSKPGINQ
jgi:WD40 repeat protein